MGQCDTCHMEKTDAHVTNEAIQNIDIDLIGRGRFQMRRDFNERRLQDMASSIRQHGLVQPIVVRPVSGSDRFEIIAGERRWRGAQLACLQQVPAIVRNASDEETAAVALIENIQREDLNPVELATGLEALQEELLCDQNELAEAVGWERSRVTHALRILKLPNDVKDLIEDGRLSAGHARILAGLSEQVARRLAQEVASTGMSVRQLEKKAKATKGEQGGGTSTTPDPNVAHLEQRITERLNAPAKLATGSKGGRITITYFSNEELDGILAKMGIRDDVL